MTRLEDGTIKKFLAAAAIAFAVSVEDGTVRIDTETGEHGIDGRGIATKIVRERTVDADSSHREG